MKPLSTFLFASSIKIAFFDFDGVFTDNYVYVDQSGRESVRCSRYDGFGISLLKSSGIVPMVISTETNCVVKMRCEKLQIECYSGVSNKLSLATDIVRQQGFTLDKCSFMGNDINDIALLDSVLLPVIPANPYPILKSKQYYSTQVKAGKGCVRELCEFLGAPNEQT
jgi:3-deoxy-D-manno-octulosonate 8-phosphate phosphatase (KDO 8-P phosphatase)